MTDTKQTLADRLFAIDTHTLDDGRVRGRITDVAAGDERATFTIEVLTTGETIERGFAIPAIWEDSEPLVELVESCGYSAASVEHMVGEEIGLVENEDAWELEIQGADQDGPVSIQFLAGASLGGAIVAPFLTLYIAWTALTVGGVDKEEGAFYIGAVGMGLFLVVVFVLARSMGFI